jgi:hypothetical protein
MLYLISGIYDNDIWAYDTSQAENENGYDDIDISVHCDVEIFEWYVLSGSCLCVSYCSLTLLLFPLILSSSHPLTLLLSFYLILS